MESRDLTIKNFINCSITVKPCEKIDVQGFSIILNVEGARPMAVAFYTQEYRAASAVEKLLEAQKAWDEFMSELEQSAL